MTENKKDDIKRKKPGHSETAITSPLGGFILSSNLSAPKGEVASVAQWQSDSLPSYT